MGEVGQIIMVWDHAGGHPKLAGLFKMELAVPAVILPKFQIQGGRVVDGAIYIGGAVQDLNLHILGAHLTQIDLHHNVTGITLDGSLLGNQHVDDGHVRPGLTHLSLPPVQVNGTLASVLGQAGSV